MFASYVALKQTAATRKEQKGWRHDTQTLGVDKGDVKIDVQCSEAVIIHLNE